MLQWIKIPFLILEKVLLFWAAGQIWYTIGFAISFLGSLFAVCVLAPFALYFTLAWYGFDGDLSKYRPEGETEESAENISEVVE